MSASDAGRSRGAAAPAKRAAALSIDDPRQLFEAAFDHLGDMVAICDADGQFVFLNPAARALVLEGSDGRTLDRANWGDWYDTDDRRLAADDWPLRRALRGELCPDVEVSRIAPDGTRFWMLIYAAPIRSADGRIIGAVATAKDITQRKQAEAEARALNEELARRVGARTAAFEQVQRELAREVRGRLDAADLLERSRRMLQGILDRTTAVIYVKDSSFRYVLVNSEFERIFHVANAAVAGRTDYELFAPEIVAPLRANDAQVLATGEPLRCDEVVPLDDGLHTYVSLKFPLRDDSGAIYAVCGISTDITERKVIEAELRSSQATLANVIESSGDAIFLVDRDHRMVLCNGVMRRNYAALTGQPLRLGVELRWEVPEPFGGRWHTLIDHALSGEPLTVEETVTLGDAKRHLLVSLNPIREDGLVSGVTVFAKDITELRAAEERAHQHQAELAHVLRLHTMGQMAASLAHEINQPLGAIANYAQGSRRRLDGGTMATTEVSQTMSEIAREALRAGEITRRVRDLIRKEVPQRQPADLNEIVSAALTIVAPAAGDRGATLRFRQGAFLPAVAVDSIQIEQVVMNLLLNALDAVEHGDGVREIEVRTRSAGGHDVEVAVCDSGIGIDPALLERVFEPFHTSKPHGLGMGLAISRSIIDAHDGRLWAAPNRERGTTFTFTLPAVERP
jgi:PAS domain S-box-containing protein